MEYVAVALVGEDGELLGLELELLKLELDDKRGDNDGGGTDGDLTGMEKSFSFFITFTAASSAANRLRWLFAAGDVIIGTICVDILIKKKVRRSKEEIIGFN
jgi:hypothetical protein